MRPHHRGAYEHLWSEQKYAVLAVSSKRFQVGSRRLGAKPPKILGFLDQLSKLETTERGEFANAWLTAYALLKDRLDRAERRLLIEGFLAGDPTSSDRLYELIIQHREAGLFGCRLFFPQRGLYKFWDFQDQPGLWLLLGPLMLHAGFASIRARLEIGGGCVGAALDDRLAALRRGIPRREFEEWPQPLREALISLVMVAIPGERVWLHPRVELPLPPALPEQEEAAGAALAALETYWDDYSHDMPLLPDDDDWLERFSPERLPGVAWTMPERPLDAIEFVRRAFREQGEAEGRARENEENDAETAPSEAEEQFDPHDDGDGEDF